MLTVTLLKLCYNLKSVFMHVQGEGDIHIGCSYYCELDHDIVLVALLVPLLLLLGLFCQLDLKAGKLLLRVEKLQSITLSPRGWCGLQ